jgi:hypothetical protein
MVGQAVQRKVPAFLLIKNRPEGRTPKTIEAVADQLV